MSKLHERNLKGFLEKHDINCFQPNWNLNMSLSELFKNNTYVIVDRNYIPNKNDNCIKGYCLYFKYPNSDEYLIKIAVNRHGYVYLGDYKPDKNYPEEFIIDIYQELMAYRDWILYMDSNKTKLLDKDIDYDKI